jgi:micrococcal nuclease
MYTYKAKLVRVINGDTLDIEIDLGFDLSIKQRLKLYGVDTPDSRSTDLEIRQKGLDVKQRVIEVLTKEFTVTTILNKRGKYGRILGKIYVVDEKDNKVCINELLVEEGHASRYNIGK